MPASPAFGKQRTGSDQADHVHVVPAGVRHRRDLGSPCLVHRQLGVGMDVFIDGFQFRKYRVNICKDRCWPFLIGHSEILSTGMLHCLEIQATTIVARVSVWRVASWKKAPDMGVAAN